MTTSFLGVPITGEINKPGVDQKTLDDLAPLFRAVLDDPNVDSIRWTQYTPYFNDGEPCYFRVGDVGFYPSAAARAGYKSGGDGADVYTMAVNDYHEHPVFGRYHGGDYEGRFPETFERCRLLSKAIGSDEFDAVLLAAFGDHAEVTVRASGIKVDSYDHN